MSKYSHQEKIEAVLRVIEEGMSEAESAHILGCSENMVHQWKMHYEQGGIESLLITHGTYTGDFKVNVIEYMHANHLSTYATAAIFNIPSKATVGKWERIYYEEGPQGLYRDNRGRKPKMSSGDSKKRKLNKKVEEDLIAENQRLRMENEYLKKLQALVQERIIRENGKEPPSSTN